MNAIMKPLSSVVKVKWYTMNINPQAEESDDEEDWDKLEHPEEWQPEK